MRVITLKNVSKSYGPTVALDDVSCNIAFGKKVAVVGENGAGKSTLLKIITGQLEPDEGTLFGMGDCAYIAQDFSGSPEESPYDFFASRLANPSKAIELLADMQFEAGNDQERLKQIHCDSLSGGELKKLEIAAGLAANKPFIALDEPENHLDYQTIEWLVGELSHFKGGLIFVSHDQYLIDALADTIIELDRGHLTAYTMGYEEYLDAKVRDLAALGREWEIERKTLERLKKTVEMMRVRVMKSPNTAATYRQMKRRYEELKEKHTKHPPKLEPDKPGVRLRGVEQKKGKLIASIEDVSFSYGKRMVLDHASAELRFGDKVVLFGRNGAGKSTLLNLLIGKLAPSSGVVRLGNNVSYQIMTQDHLAGIDASMSAFGVMHDSLGWDETRSRGLLKKHGLSEAVMGRPLMQLSGGQQARFKLALTFAQAPEFLILDEPTNHVDPPTWEAIVEALKEFDGTVLAITHDRAFIDAIAQKLWILEDGKIREFLGNVSQYLAPPATPVFEEDDYHKYMIDE